MYEYEYQYKIRCKLSWLELGFGLSISAVSCEFRARCRTPPPVTGAVKSESHPSLIPAHKTIKRFSKPLVLDMVISVICLCIIQFSLIQLFGSFPPHISLFLFAAARWIRMCRVAWLSAALPAFVCNSARNPPDRCFKLFSCAGLAQEIFAIKHPPAPARDLQLSPKW